MRVAPKRKLRDWPLYVALRNVEALLQAVPWATARHGARLLADLVYLLNARRRNKMALANLRRAFPSLGQKDVKLILRDVYRHVMESVLDGMNFARFAGRWDSNELLEAVGFDRLREVAPRTGVIFVSGHFGHWELLGAALPLLGYPVWSVARGFRNPLIDRYVHRLRERTGQRMLHKHGSLRRVIRLLQRGENVGFLIDQDARRQGIFVDFFGRPAATTPVPARLSIYTGAPLAFVYAERVDGERRFRLVLKELIFPGRTEDSRGEARRITQRLTSDLEGVIRRAPQRWLWLHRRWKTYPGKYGRA